MYFFSNFLWDYRLMLHWSMPKTGMKLAVVSNLFLCCLLWESRQGFSGYGERKLTPLIIT